MKLSVLLSFFPSDSLFLFVTPALMHQLCLAGSTRSRCQTVVSSGSRGRWAVPLTSLHSPRENAEWCLGFWPPCDGVARCALPPASVTWRTLPPPENPLPFCSVAFLPASFGKCPPTWSLSWLPSPTGAWVGTPSLVFLLRPFYSSSHCSAYNM